MLPARVFLLFAGVFAVGLGVFNLQRELDAGEVDRLYAGLGLAAFALWLGAIVLAAIRGSRPAVFTAGALAFIEFALIASSHFVSGPSALGTFVKREGLEMATVDLSLVLLCLLVVMSAAVAWTNPDGRSPSLETLPILIVALVGSFLVILQATDDLNRIDFGTANVEDGAFAAAVVASGWLAGGLWIARVRRTGALLIAVSTFIVWYSFVTLHVVHGTTISGIASKSGAFWAFSAAGAAILAGASFLTALGLLVRSVVGPKRVHTAVASRAVRRGA